MVIWKETFVLLKQNHILGLIEVLGVYFNSFAY